MPYQTKTQTRCPLPNDHGANRGTAIPFGAKVATADNIRRVATALALRCIPGVPSSKIRRHIGKMLKAYPGETAEQIVRHANLSLLYERQRKAKAPPPWAPPLTMKRMADLEALFVANYGGNHLPDDDAGERDLEIAAHHLAHAYENPVGRIIAWAAAWCPWMPTERAKSFAERVVAHPQKWKSVGLGRELNVTREQYERLGLSTIRPNIAPEEWEARARERRRQYDRERWAAKATGRSRGRPRKTRPNAWEAEGISRATYFRRKAKAKAKPGSKRETKNVHTHLSSEGERFSSHMASPAAATGTSGPRSPRLPTRVPIMEGHFEPYPPDTTVGGDLQSPQRALRVNRMKIEHGRRTIRRAASTGIDG